MDEEKEKGKEIEGYDWEGVEKLKMETVARE